MSSKGVDLIPKSKKQAGLTPKVATTGYDKEVIEAQTAGLFPELPPIPPLPPPPTSDDPRIAAAREKQRLVGLKRKGRRSAILTSGRGVKEPLGTVNRPSAQLLGG